MKRLILAIYVIAFSTVSVNAQTATKSSFSIAGNIGIPTTSGLSLAYGGDVQADFGVATGLKITVSAGYEDYSVKGGGINLSGVIPLLAGAKFALGSDKLYGHAQLGYAVSTAKGGSGAFAYAPSIGYYLSPNFDASIKYLAFGNNGTIGSINLRLAYNF